MTLFDVQTKVPDYKIERFTQDDIGQSVFLTLRTRHFEERRRQLVLLLMALPEGLVSAGFAVLDAPGNGDDFWVLHRGCGDNYTRAETLFYQAPYYTAEETPDQ